MNGLLQEFRLAWRSLLRQPGFLAVAVLTLALGVGSVSAIYSVVDGVLLKPLPYPQAERIIRVSRVQGQWSGPVSGPVLQDWQAGTEGVFASLGAFTETTINLTGDGDAERLAGYQVTPEFWDAMGLAPQLGRYFGSTEERADERVVVLSHGLWQRRFGGDPGVVGRDITLNGEGYRVVGVAPDAFRYPAATQVYLPTWLPSSQRPRGSNFLFVLGRLQPGATLEQAEAALAAVNARLDEEFPAENANLGARLTPLPELLNSRVRQPLLILLGASALVLLIACANLANLLLARGSRRQRELAVRAALGAGRAALVRGVMVEALLLALIGGTLGLALAVVAVPALLSLAPGIVPSHSTPGMSPAVVLVSLAAAVATVLLFALLPALRASDTAPGAALQEEARGSGGRNKARARSLLVAAEVALSLTLLIGAGLLIESLRQLGKVETGVNTEGVLTAAVVIDALTPHPGEEMLDLYRRHTLATAPKLDAIVERVAAIPGVEAVGISDALPLSGINNISSNIGIVGREVAEGDPQPRGNWRFVNPGFFDAVGMRVLRGRDLEQADQRPGEFPLSVLVNETFARQFLPGVDPIGERLTFGLGPDPVAIVGVVNDSLLFGLDQQAAPEIYLAHSNATQSQFHLAIKVRGEPMAHAEQLRIALRELDPNIPVFDIRSMDQVVAGTTQMRRFNMGLMSVFSGVALLLAVVGLYGVIAYSVAQRRHEIGIRMSLGAAPQRVLRMVMGQGMRLVGAGLALGLLGAFALGRVLSSQLYGVGTGSPAVIASVTAVLLAASLFACLVPAWRAARLDPAGSLRDN